MLAKVWEKFQELYGVTACPVPGLIELARQLEEKATKATAASGSQPAASSGEAIVALAAAAAAGASLPGHAIDVDSTCPVIQDKMANAIDAD